MLAERVRALSDGDVFGIAELAADGLVVWEVSRDENGLPRCWHSRSATPWQSLYHDGVPSADDIAAVIGTRLADALYVCSTPDGQHALDALEWLGAEYPDADIAQCVVPLDNVLREVLRRDPLTRWYDLVVLRPTRSGRLRLTTRNLFPPGAKRGDRRRMAIRCEPGEDDGTAFAVVARRSTEGQQFRLVSVQSADLAPGIYDLDAELRWPGAVRFRHPPGLHDDHRGWADLVTSVPDRYLRLAASHLICLIERNGTEDELKRRLEAAADVIQRADGRFSVSVLGYGPHVLERGLPDPPPQVLTWAEGRDDALDALEALKKQGAVDRGYIVAAKIECALDEVAERLDGEGGRPVVLTVGGRPAFPPQVDPSEILPCRRGRDWRNVMRRLRQWPGIVFGAIHDRELVGDLWLQLGSDARCRAEPTAFDPHRLAVDLGLVLTQVQHMPFPLVDAEEG